MIFLRLWNLRAREQKFTSGSYAATAGRISYIGSKKVEFSVIVKPTILTGKPQTIMSLGNKEINIDGEGQVCWMSPRLSWLRLSP